MPLIVSFVAGFLVAQTTWWFVARGSLGAADEYALGGAPTFRFLMLAGVEVLVAAVVFGGVLMFLARARQLSTGAKACFVSAVAGATTATIAAGPYALIPRIVQGEAMLLVYIVAAALVSAAFAALVAAAFRGEPIPETASVTENH